MSRDEQELRTNPVHPVRDLVAAALSGLGLDV